MIDLPHIIKQKTKSISKVSSDLFNDFKNCNLFSNLNYLTFDCNSLHFFNAVYEEGRLSLNKIINTNFIYDFVKDYRYITRSQFSTGNFYTISNAGITSLKQPDLESDKIYKIANSDSALEVYKILNYNDDLFITLEKHKGYIIYKTKKEN